MNWTIKQDFVIQFGHRSFGSRCRLRAAAVVSTDEFIWKI
jgi:hypothetical protein